MKTFRGQTGLFAERPFFSDREIDQMCEDALFSVGLLPSKPEAIRVERFIEKHFRTSPIYEDLPAGVLGYTSFSAQGVSAVHVAKTLLDEGTVTAERRVNTTLAHEAGHGLMHAHLFAFREANPELFEGDPDVSATRVLCRDGDRGLRRGYDGRWWELQANKAIGALLLPRTLIRAAIAPYMVEHGLLGTLAVDSSRRDEAVRSLAEIFDVNPAVSRIRLDGLYPETAGQLHL